MTSCLCRDLQAPKKKTSAKKKIEKKVNPLFSSEPRSYRVGGAIRVRWRRRREHEDTHHAAAQPNRCRSLP